MASPHPALRELAAGRPLPEVDDWDRLLLSAREHRLSGLLNTWANSGDGHVPEHCREALRREDLSSWARHARLWKVLTVTSERLANLGIEVATAKGVTAEARWYDRIGERPCKDIDLLLAPEDVSRIEEVVATLHPDHPLRSEVASLVGRDTLQSIDLRVDGVEVDLHTDILKLGIGSRQRDLIWQRTVLVPTPHGGRVRVLDPETSLALFLVHLNKDRFRYLLGFVDVHRLIEREDLDWGFLWDFLRREGIELHGALTLQTVADTLRVALPTHTPPGGWRAVLWQMLWRPSKRLQGDFAKVAFKRSHFWIPFLARGRLDEALRWWRQVVFPPRALLAGYLPETSGPYLWRLLTGRLRDAIRRRRRAAELAAPPSGRR
jgi:hypothetical protein